MKTTQRASGTFQVKVTPVTGGDNGAASGRMSLAKTFDGSLKGTSAGDMWTASTLVSGSAGYVAIERFEGSLDGRAGSFVLLHQGTMHRGADFQLRIVVVPDSGTGQLAGLAGTMAITIDGSAHSYELEYSLGE